MFSYQVDEELHKLLSLYDEAESLMRLLDVASSKHGAIDLVVKQLTAEPDKVAQSRDNLNNHLVLLRKEFGAISPRLIYSSIEALKGGFETLEILNKSVAEISLSSELDSFTISYEDYLQQYSTETAITLINSAQKLKERLFWFRQGALSFGVWGKIPDYEYSNGRALSIVLCSEMDMLDFIEKLNSISNIYISRFAIY